MTLLQIYFYSSSPLHWKGIVTEIQTGGWIGVWLNSYLPSVSPDLFFQISFNLGRYVCRAWCLKSSKSVIMYFVTYMCNGKSCGVHNFSTPVQFFCVVTTSMQSQLSESHMIKIKDFMEFQLFFRSLVIQQIPGEYPHLLFFGVDGCCSPKSMDRNEVKWELKVGLLLNIENVYISNSKTMLHYFHIFCSFYNVLNIPIARHC